MSSPAPPVRRLSVLMPVYNEARTLRLIVDRMLAVALPCELEIVAVDDCSTDGSGKVLEGLAQLHPVLRVIHHKRNRGKGAAIRTAIANMTGDWAIIQDADLEYDPQDWLRMLVPAQEGIADAVFGSRFVTSGYRRALYFWHSLANHALTTFSNMLNDLNLTDVMTCYKLMRADVLKSLRLRSTRFEIEAELTAKLARWGARIYEVPISYRGRNYAEGKKVRATDALRCLGAMFRYRVLDQDYTTHDGFMILQAVRRARRFNKWMMDQFEEFVGENILEAGSGIGNLTEMLLDKPRLVATDYEDFYVDRLEHKYGYLPNFRVLRADLLSTEDLDKASAGRAFDTILCTNVLEHIEDDVRVLRNFHDLLEPGGHAIILVPHDPALYTEVDRTLGHFRRYTRRELSRKMQEAGFKVLQCKGFNRVGGLGWRISGKVLRQRTLSPGQMTLFELGLPIIRELEKFPFHAHNSVICIGRRE